MEMENENKEPTAPETVEELRNGSEDGGAPLEASEAGEPTGATLDAPTEAIDAADAGAREAEPADAEETADEPAAEADAPTTETEAPAESAEPERESRARKTASKKTAKPKKAAAAGKKETAVAIDEVPSESKLPMKWYVIHTYSGHENKVKENILKMVKTSTIKDQFGRLIVPTEEVAEMKKGKKTITTRKFFPSYILIEMHISEDSWHLVNGIPGVTSFVGAGTKPQPLSEPEVERILGRMDKDRGTIIPEIPFTLGEHIRIKDGPFSDFTGIIDEINTEKGKLKVLVSIFGRETPVELDFLQVEPI
jgi:transcription termination/antitermination protein NusG